MSCIKSRKIPLARRFYKLAIIFLIFVNYMKLKQDLAFPILYSDSWFAARCWNCRVRYWYKRKVRNMQLSLDFLYLELCWESRFRIDLEMVDKSDIVGQSYVDGSRPRVSRVILVFLCRQCLVKQIHQYMGSRVIVFTVTVWNWNISSCWWLDPVACPRHEGWTAVIPCLINPQIQPPALVRNLRLLGSLFLSIVIDQQRTDSRDWVLDIHCSWRPRFCPCGGVSLSPLYIVHAPVWRDSVMRGLVESNATSRTPTPHIGISHSSIGLDCSCMTSCNSWS